MVHENHESPDLILVGCVKTKGDRASRARDLYASTLWKYRLCYAETHGCPWYIISAQHWLLHPDTRIEPYNLTLKTASVSERREWSKRVLEDLEAAFPELHGKSIEIHAGNDYAGYGLEDGLRRRGATGRRPLKEVASIGRQFAWYREHMAACPQIRKHERR